MTILSKKMLKLKQDFFNRPTLQVAQELLGKTLIFKNHQGIITETEAYTQDDPACHAFRGLTPRTKIMFGPAGFSYVYFIYGMYYCLNFVTEEEGVGAAVLIRGLLTRTHHLDGPGKLCKYLGITKEHNEINITQSIDFHLLDTPSTSYYESTPRIGISKAKDRLWRFVLKKPHLRKIQGAEN